MFPMVISKQTITWISMFILIGGASTSNIVKPLKKEHILGEFSYGKLYYRTFYMDNSDDVLYVGAMDHIFKLDLFNINASHPKTDKLELITSRIPYWISEKPYDLNSHNHIKVIQSFGKDRLYICGSHAEDPRNWIINKNLTRISKNDDGWLSAYSICSKYLDQNDASVMVTKNHIDDDEQQLYTTIGDNLRGDSYPSSIFRTKFNLNNTYLAATEIRSSSSNIKFLFGESVNVVGSFEIEDQIFFFFSEYGTVDDNHNEILAIENQIETIESIYKIPNDNTHFYGTFTATQNNSVTSAICFFSIDDIKKAFDGPFRKVVYYDDTLNSSETIPEPNPNLCSRNLTEKRYSKAPYFLMDYVIPSKQNRIIFNITNVILTKLVVDKLMSNVTGVDAEYTVYYAGSNKGRVYKLVQWTNEKGKIRTEKLDEFDVTPDEEIRAMEISSKYSSLYVASDNCIKQISSILCNRHKDDPRRCKRDPYCKLDIKNKKNCELQVNSNKIRRSNPLNETTAPKPALRNANSTQNIKTNNSFETTTIKTMTENFIAKYNKLPNITTENPSTSKFIKSETILDQDIPTTTIVPQISTTDILQNFTMFDDKTTISDRIISTSRDVSPVLHTTGILQNATTISGANISITTDIPTVMSTTDMIQNLTTASSDDNISTTNSSLVLNTTDFLQIPTTDIPPMLSIPDMLQNLTTASSDDNISTTNISLVLNTTDLLQIPTTDKSISTTDIPPMLSIPDMLQNLITTSSDNSISMTTDMPPVLNTTDIPPILSTTDLLQNSTSTNLSLQDDYTMAHSKMTM
ncbi:hypothetical protein HCN44_009200 [Aphidius gifuensis]|uniref:Sema domain-containing protein n=1 Tax=Aphidius gifuensis TaxID=684658 RepID=A0A835CVU2_APHGI|nr:hypothetical protein HCN44_009200 [Aphidius gifuensis]